MEDQTYKLTNIAGYTSRHYGPSEDWTGGLHKWLPPEFKPRRGRKGPASAPARLPVYNAATKKWSTPQAGVGPSQSLSTNAESNQAAVSTPRYNPARLSYDDLKEEPQGLGYGSGYAISSSPQFTNWNPSFKKRYQWQFNGPQYMDMLAEGLERLDIVYTPTSSSGRSQDEQAAAKMNKNALPLQKQNGTKDAPSGPSQNKKPQNKATHNKPTHNKSLQKEGQPETAKPQNKSSAPKNQRKSRNKRKKPSEPVSTTPGAEATTT